MGLASDENSDSFGDCSLELFIKLVHTDSVAEIEDRIIVGLASKNNCNIKGDKNIVVGGSGSHWEFIGDILLCDQKLDFSPRQAKDHSSFLLDSREFTVLGDHGVGSLWPNQKIMSQYLRYLKKEML